MENNHDTKIVWVAINGSGALPAGDILGEYDSPNKALRATSEFFGLPKNSVKELYCFHQATAVLPDGSQKKACCYCAVTPQEALSILKKRGRISLRKKLEGPEYVVERREAMLLTLTY